MTPKPVCIPCKGRNARRAAGLPIYGAPPVMDVGSSPASGGSARLLIASATRLLSVPDAEGDVDAGGALGCRGQVTELIVEENLWLQHI